MTRPAYGTREHFDYSANGDGLPEMEPCFAEEMQPELVGSHSWTVLPMFAVMVALLVGIWA